MNILKRSKHLLLVFGFLTLSSTALARPDRIVLGYVPCRRDAIASPDDFNYDAVTHLARAFIREQADGSLEIPDNYFSESFEKAARSHGVKLLMSIGGGSSTADHWQPLAHDPQHVRTFVDAVAKLLAEHHYDGIDIDWEPPPATDADGKEYAAFLQSLRTRFPTAIITLALSGEKKSRAHIPFADVVPSIDFINVMAYSYATPGSGLAGFNANLHDDPQGSHTRHSVDEAMAALLEEHHVPPSKVLLGMTFWASRFHADKLGDSFPAHSKGYADSIEYPEVLDLINTGRYNALHDAVADASYLVRKTGGCVITYDDPASIKAKCEDAKKLNCAGVMIWHLGADLAGGETPLLSTIAESFGMPRLPASRSALEREVVRLSGKPVPATATLESLLKLDAQLRGSHTTQDDDQWTANAPK